ncbi:ABC transporter substrate-binding protein [Paeniglutamicibacter sp. Y32M11]|uniref:ABC transporter substrate-binding protein n=1 Tax=Paeniglutamicibacter sp. Y32M11 TaxID=2853258 RepID=UPI001C52B801|nr:ABC transporter substrate-binding protein [Paeniglutamicibacter sp. Y32M11]QXQ10385.1 ABC transporter substrate-binding protein [Paeniglutamicibacter sp. Y32M11]
MSQPIDAGAVLGGRYQVTESVLTSADGDQVLSGIDQVLNRPVSILVGSTANASQLATSAREIATGERYATVQVLDLGISEGHTYLVTNLAEPADLLDLVIQADAPYVEPFYTDTLGTEIFGVSRSTEPATYEDDAEYYEDQRAQEQQRPAMLDRFPEISLNEKLNNIKGRFTRGKAAGETPMAPAAAVGSNTEQAPAVAPVPTTTSPTTPPAAASPTVAPAEPVAAPAPKPAAPKPTPKVSRISPDDEPAVTSAAALAAAQKSRGPNLDESGQRAASSFPVAAQTYSADPVTDYEDEEEAEEGGKKTTRLLIGALLCAVLVLAVVFAYNALGNKNPEPVANPSATQSAAPSNSAGSSSEASEKPSAEVVKPVVADISRVVPGNQDLNAPTDNTLSNVSDGNPASLYKSYSYTTPQFGGLASNMVIVAELEEVSDISEIKLEGMNGTGGAFEIRVGESDDLSDAKTVTSGSFTGPSVTIPVNGDDGESLRGQYVFLNVTELPRRASGANESRPYGLQLGEFGVS